MIATLDQMSRPKKPPTRHVRMRKDMAEMLDIIAAQRGKDLPELMDDLFKSMVVKEYGQSLEHLQKLNAKNRKQIES